MSHVLSSLQYEQLVARYSLRLVGGFGAEGPALDELLDGDGGTAPPGAEVTLKEDHLPGTLELLELQERRGPAGLATVLASQAAVHPRC